MVSFSARQEFSISITLSNLKDFKALFLFNDLFFKTLTFLIFIFSSISLVSKKYSPKSVSFSKSISLNFLLFSKPTI